MKIAIIGAGRVATQFALTLKEQVAQVYSLHLDHARQLAAQTGAQATDSLEAVIPDADLYLLAVKDDALADVAQRLARHLPSTALLAHTAGSMALNVLPTQRRAVIYPLQTFSKERPADFSSIFLFVEAAQAADLALVRDFALTLTPHVVDLKGSDRARLHLAAVFACNFTNHLYDLAACLLEEAGIPFNVLRPLIDETAAKVHSLTPRAAQTGPALRWDENVISRHLGMLDGNPKAKAIYQLLSESIHDQL